MTRLEDSINKIRSIHHSQLLGRGSMDATIHTDGAARGNPGPAAAAYVIEMPGSLPFEHAETLGSATNNVAEYTALILALERAASLGIRRATVYSDSELMVKQFHGEYAVKNAELKQLHADARDLARRFDVLTLRHVRRAENRRADSLCNLALDGGPPGARRRKTGSGRRTTAAKRDPAIDEQAVACLRSALSAARDGGRSARSLPTAEQLWEQLWSVLEEGGLLKAGRKSSS
jgi:ribonuclease HI